VSKPWKTLRREVILDRSPWLVVENHTIELPDGELIDDWAWVKTPDYVNVAAITTDDLFVCFRQTQYAAAGETLATVGGYVENGESPLEAARRELREETGYESAEWTHLGSFAVDGNRGAGTAHLFVAEGATCVGEPKSDDLEDQQLLLLTQAEAARALRAGEFKVLSWAATLGLALASLTRADAVD